LNSFIYIYIVNNVPWLQSCLVLFFKLAIGVGVDWILISMMNGAVF